MTKLTNHTTSAARMRKRILGSVSIVAVSALMTSGVAVAAGAPANNEAPVATNKHDAVLMAQVEGEAPEQAAARRAAEDADVDVIVVKGIRSSLENAVAIKRHSDTVVDSISAESIGRFPDLNLAESMQRISGVDIIRDDFRQGKVAVRGISGFTTVTVNGQDLASPSYGGGFVFGMFESSVMSGVDVHKTPKVSMDEGGIAGTINLKTRRALDFDDDFHASVAVKGQHEHLSGKTIPDIGGSIGIKNDEGTLGAYITAGYQKRNFRSDSFKVKEYYTVDPDGNRITRQDWKDNPDLISDALWIPMRTSLTSRKTTGDRISLAGGLEWRPTDDFSLSYTALYGEDVAEQPINNLSVMTFGEIGPNRIFDYTVLDTLDSGSAGITATRVRVDSPQMQVQERILDNEFESFGSTLEADWRKGPWNVLGALHYTKGESFNSLFQVTSRRENRARNNWAWVQVDNGLVADVNIGQDNPYDAAVRLNLSPADIGTFGWSTTNTIDAVGGTWDHLFAGIFPGNNSTKTETIAAAQIDVSRDWDFDAVPFIDSVDFGVKFKKVKQDRNSKSFGGAKFNQWGGLDLSVWDDSFFKDSFMNEGRGFFAGDIYFQGLLVPDAVRSLNGLPAVDPSTLDEDQRIDEKTGLVYRISDSSRFRPERETLAAYASVNFDQELSSDLRLRGNVGVRYIDTKRLSRTDATDYSSGVAVREDVIGTKDFQDFLPQANLIVDVGDDIILRGSWSKTLSRPDPNTLQSGSRVFPTYVGGDPTAPLTGLTKQNDRSQLEPFYATSFDVSAEWYNRAGSSVTLGAFTKEITNFYTGIQECHADIDGLQQYITGTPAIDANGDCVFVDSSGNDVTINATRTFNSPDNKYTVTGIEIGVTQNLDFLDGFWSNFGITANYSYKDDTPALSNVESETAAWGLQTGQFEETFQKLFSFSDHTFNIIPYYETDKFGIRLAGNYRSAFLDNDNFGGFRGFDRTVDARMQWDMSGTYHVNDALNLSFEIVNIFDKDRYEYQATSNRFRALYTEGRTLTMSLGYTF